MKTKAQQKLSDYLKTPTWKKLRLEAIKRADCKCQLCNSTRFLQVHHRQYPKVLGEEPVNWLTCLCRDCHKLFHMNSYLKNTNGLSKRTLK